MRQIKEKLQAITLRERGYSLNEIVVRVGVAKSTASLWVRNIPLSEKARERLLTKIKLGQVVSAERKRGKTQALIQSYFDEATRGFNENFLNKKQIRVLCSLLYWCEGAKSQYNGVHFVNSDPALIRLFLKLFHEGFSIDKKRIIARIHLHQYHNPGHQLKFWSQATGLSPSQFRKPYLKPNTGKRIRKDYPGCIAIRYGSNNIARELLTTAKAFMAFMGA